MRTLAWVSVLVLSAVLNSLATDIVYDPINHATAVVDEIRNIVQWTETEIHTANTDLQTLESYENSVVQLERLGDPKTLTAALPGVQNIQTLVQMYQQANKDVSDWAAYTNPQSYKITLEQIEGAYGQPAWNGFTALNGSHVALATGLLNFNVSNYNVMSGAQQTVATLNQKKQTLMQQLNEAISSMNAAGDQSAVQKYAAQITALHAAIAAVDGQIQQETKSAQLQVNQNQQAQRITQGMTEQQTEAAIAQAADQELNSLPSNFFHQTVAFPTQ